MTTDPQDEPQFGIEGCTCIPFTRQTDPPRYLSRPTDTVDMISGWERGRDCPHHAPAVSPLPDQTALRASLAEAMAKRDGHPWPTEFEDDERDYYRRADAALAVLPPPADRAAVLLEAAKVADGIADAMGKAEESWASRAKWACATVGVQLRRLAAEAKPLDGRKTGTAFSPGEGVHGLDPYYGGVEARQPDGYEATTGHLITCFAVAGGNPDPDCSCATEAQQPDTRPRRGDQFEAWLKAQRDAFGWQGANRRDMFDAFDNLLDLYRLHADTGTPLGEHVCEGRAVGDCECLEPAVPVQPAADGSSEGAGA